MRLSRNVIWNASGIVLPMLVGIAVVPVIVRELGIDRLGLLSAIWVLIGYFSVFDLGLSRTLTKLVADRLGERRETEIPPLVSTTLILVTISALLMGGVIFLSADWIAQRVADDSPALAAETSAAIVWVAIGLPFVLIATVWVGLLEAYQKFALISAVRFPMGSLMYLVPLGVLPFSRDLGVITAALTLLRIGNACVLTLLGLRTVPALRGRLLRFRRDLVRPLLTFGGWLTVSNVVGPVMVYFDRFFIAALMGTAAIAYYTVPYDVLTRLWVLPAAIQGVLFPAFIIMRNQNPTRLVAVFKRSSETTLLLLAPALLATLLLGRGGLQLWLGSEFAEHSTRVAEILMIGVLANAMARTPFAFVQSAGYANWTAIVHLIELPVYTLLLWWALFSYGIDGAASVWTARMAIDMIIFYALAGKLEVRLARTGIRDLAALTIACGVALLADATVDDLTVRILLVVALGLVCGSMLAARLKGAILSLPANRPANPG